MASNFSLNIDIEIEDNSPEVLRAVENAIDRALNSIGEAAGGYAKDIILEHKRVDTGNMMNSIDHRTGDNIVVIGTDVEYAPYHEFGTSRGLVGIKFLQRGVGDHLDEYKDLLQESLENA